MGLTILCKTFCTFNLNAGKLCKIMSVPQNTLMDLNNVMNARE